MRFPLSLSATLAAYIVCKKIKREPFPPLVLMLEPLFACNLSCSTCGRIREYRNIASKQLTLKECVASAEECRAPIVSICGGEPLLYHEIDKLVGMLTAMGRYVYLCTNGLLLEQNLNRLSPSRRLLLNVHLDGLADTHDAICERRGAYEAAVRGIRSAIEKGFQVTVNTTVCKQTDMSEIDTMMRNLAKMGVRSFMLSPAFAYDAVEHKDNFMSRADIRQKFHNADLLAARHRLADTPIYLDFLQGRRELECSAWGNPTRNPAGWRSPCYLIADRHFASYRELLEKTDWYAYGAGRNPRCANCMVHCGFEPTAALMRNKQRGDLWRLIRWQFG